jgi:ribosome modulation factor
MADRMIYLVDKLTKAMEDSSVPCVDDEGLNDLLAKGLEVVSTLPSASKDVGGKKRVKVTPMLLRAKTETKALALVDAEPDEPLPRPRGGDDFSLTIPEVMPRNGGQMMGLIMGKLTQAITALSARDDASHLGSVRNHSMPGLTIVSGEVVQKAWDAGMSAGARGESMNACPFPPGSQAATRWLQGWQVGQKGVHRQEVDSGTLDRIRADAEVLARSLPDEADVSCPYPRGSQTEAAWIEGFTQGGGRKG